MQGLGDTTAMLARMRKQTRTPKGARRPGPSVMRETTAFGPNPGGLGMLSHAPAGLAPGAALVVVLHGCTQGAESYARDAGWLTLADRVGFVVVAAEQT